MTHYRFGKQGGDTRARSSLSRADESDAENGVRCEVDRRMAKTEEGIRAGREPGT